MVEVNENALKTILEIAVWNFNDCACCPLYGEECSETEGISSDCQEILLKNYLTKE